MILTSLGEALWISFLLLAAPIVSCIIIGFCCAALQAATQIQDASLTLVPKLLVFIGVTVLTLPWSSSVWTTFVEEIFATIASSEFGSTEISVSEAGNG